MGNIKRLKTKQGETILPVTGENGVILTDEQGHQVGLKNYVNGKGINRTTLDPTKVLPGSDKSTIAWLNEQDEKIQQAYVAGVGGKAKATEAYNLATTAKTKAETAERLTDEAAQSAAVADKVRVAMGYAEVGDIATKTYEAGSLLFHNGKLYVLNSRWEDGHSWDDTIVTETNVALELNKMREVLSQVTMLAGNQ